MQRPRLDRPTGCRDPAVLGFAGVAALSISWRPPGRHLNIINLPALRLGRRHHKVISIHSLQ